MQGNVAEGRTIYVGGFADDMTPEGLHAAFRTFGDIIDVTLPSDPSKHESDGPSHRNFGFVEFMDGNDALDAVDNMHENELHGKQLKVNLAKNRPNAISTGAREAIWASGEWLKSQEDNKDKESGNSTAPA